MNATQMLHEMCHQALSNADVKAISKSRGFSAQESASRALFETFFLSDIGVGAALGSLTREEVLLLHLLRLTQETADVTFFARVYGDERSTDRYYYGTFTQRYQEIFKQVRLSLVRKGVLLMAEEADAWNADTKLERWRFRFPLEFEPFLPAPIPSTHTLEGEGDARSQAVRRSLMEVVERQRPSPSQGKTQPGPQLVGGELRIGDREFRVQHLSEWLRACWETAAPLPKTKTALDKPAIALSPVQATTFLLSQLGENEWVHPGQLSLPLRIFCNAAVSAEEICAAGWRCSCLAQQQVDGQTYYRLPRQKDEDDVLAPDQYLYAAADGSVVANLETIPFTSLECLARISQVQALDTGGPLLSVLPNLIKLGQALASVREHPLLGWLRDNAPAFRQALETTQQRWGRQIIHENLLIAQIGDLGLKVQLERAFPDPQEMIFLPNDYVAFPRQLLNAVADVVARSGHVIKTLQPESEQ